MWLGWILASSVTLSIYDLSKKASVRGNAAFPVLLISTLCGWLAVTVLLIVRGEVAAVLGVEPTQIVLLLVKSCLVGASWMATYLALRTLPITSAAPIRATGPIWTLLGAILLFGEVPSPLQVAGLGLALFGCWRFSLSAVPRGSAIWRDKALVFAFAGTLLGSCSALYDKRLLQHEGIPVGTVLWWFLGGMTVIYALATAIWAVRRRRNPAASDAFTWRAVIPLVGVLLAVSDACYFSAIGTSDAKISILSVIRRASVVLTFFIGGAVFRERGMRRKLLPLALILAGVVILCLAR